VRTIAALRRAAVKKSIFRYADLSLDLATRHCIRGSRPMQLTPSETELLLYFIERPEVPLSSERLREEVWGEDRQSSSEHALLPRISRLRQKLHGPGESTILHTVPSMGYMLAIPNADDPTLAGLGDLPWPGSFDQFT
jgi:DNA-binding response OmpR family regulator